MPLHFHSLKREYVGKSDGSYELMYQNTVLGKHLLKKQGEARCYRDLGLRNYSEDPSVI